MMNFHRPDIHKKLHPKNTASGWNKRYLSEQGLAVPGTFTHSNSGNRQFYKIKFWGIDRCLKMINEDLSGKTIVDIAGGSGQFLDFFLKRGAKEVLVADFSEIALQSIRQRYKTIKNVKTLLFDMKSSDYSWHTQYDFAFVMEAIFLLATDDDFEQGIQNFRAAVKQNRYLIISDVFPMQTIKQNPYVVRRSRTKFEEVLSQNGFMLIGYIPQTFFFNRHIFRRYQFTVEKIFGPLLYWADLSATMLGFRPPPGSPADVKYLIAKRIN